MNKLLFFIVFVFAVNTQVQAQDWDAFIAAYTGDNGESADTLFLEGDDSLEIAELTFRNLFAYNKAHKPRKSKFYIVSFLHCARHMYLDPDGPFMASLQDIRPKVRKTSFYYNNEPKLYGKVMFFFITDMYMTGANTATVHGGYYQSDDACAGHKWSMKRVDGLWEIDRVVIEWAL